MAEETDGENADSLWRRAVIDVRPLKNRNHAVPSGAGKSPPRILPALQAQSARSAPVSTGQRAPLSGTDGKTDRKLKQGKMRPEARLDLHGLTRERAHEALARFVHRCYDEGRRSVLVITGKGKARGENDPWYEPGGGVLRENVPRWLETPPLSGMILRIAPAVPRDGGDGALYVLLRRKRT